MTKDFSESKEQIRSALGLGIHAEYDWPELPPVIRELDSEAINWIASWLASEGIGRVSKP